jgi:hypothetical protein
MGGIVRVGGRGRRHAGEFAGRGLAQDHGAGAAQQRNASRIRRRPVAAIDRRTHLGRHIERIDDVLDPDRHAVQRAAARFAIERMRLRKRQFRIELHPGFDDRLARDNTFDAIARDGFARHLARGDLRHDLSDG